MSCRISGTPPESLVIEVLDDGKGKRRGKDWLLPPCDIATIPEKRADQKTPAIPEEAGPASAAASPFSVKMPRDGGQSIRM